MSRQCGHVRFDDGHPGSAHQAVKHATPRVPNPQDYRFTPAADTAWWSGITFSNYNSSTGQWETPPLNMIAYIANQQYFFFPTPYTGPYEGAQYVIGMDTQIPANPAVFVVGGGAQNQAFEDILSSTLEYPYNIYLIVDGVYYTVYADAAFSQLFAAQTPPIEGGAFNWYFSGFVVDQGWYWNGLSLPVNSVQWNTIHWNKSGLNELVTGVITNPDGDTPPYLWANTYYGGDAPIPGDKFDGYFMFPAQ